MSRDDQAQPAILWIEVDDIDASIEVVTAAGGTTHGEINEIPGEGRVGYVRDPDDTLLGLRRPTQKSDRSQPADSPVGNLDDAGEDWLTWTSPTSAGPA
jgi:Glyoxalase/Bleomycin resistance protein/Dioxygenase superfamily